MTAERWERIKGALEEVEAVAEAERAEVLERVCAGDADMRRQVERFLAEDGTGTYFSGLVGEEAAHLGETTTRQERFGHYRVVRRIGVGGMGAVYEAVRVDDFHKKVALKIIKQGIDSEYARTRFLQERQTLAGLEHPNIARLLDGGETDDGSPYLVLEFVAGEPITQYCEGLDRTARLRLFLKVCEAVEHAHRNLVVHRDLKPANILVTEEGEPKLLDFGIAKLLEPGGMQTLTAFAGLTPDYASPEQVRGEAITTASDVYSLGVILFQLLTGRKPYTLESATSFEMDRVICQQPPIPPGLGDELDYILLMALRKEPARRYGSVQQFGLDIERYLAHETVGARPDTFGYRARKFVRRNWVAITAAAIVVVSLSGALAYSLAEERRANRRFNQVRQLSNKFLFEFYDGIANTPGTVKVREQIVTTALEYLNSLAGEAGGDAGLQWEMAVAYGKVAAAQGSVVSPSLGRTRDAADSYEKSFALARPLADRNLLDAKQRAAFVSLLCAAESVYQVLKQFDSAVRVGREAVARSGGLPDDAQRTARNQLATALGASGDLIGSLRIREQNLSKAREKAEREPSAENQWALARTLVNLCYFNGRLTRFEEAVAYGVEALALSRKLAAEKPGDTQLRRKVFEALDYLGLAEGAGGRPSLGRHEQAQARFEEALSELGLLMAADPHDNSSRLEAAITHVQIELIGAPREALRHAALAAKLADAAAPDNTDVRALPRIYAGDRHRELHEFEAAEISLKEADDILKERGGGTEADLDLAWARLELARGNAALAAMRFNQALPLYEKLFAEIATPGNAWNLVEALDSAAEAVPELGPARLQRIFTVWSDQNRRFPGVPYLEKQVRDAQARVEKKIF